MRRDGMLGLLICAALFTMAAISQAADTPSEQRTQSFAYKKAKQGALQIVVHYPPGWKETDQRPAIVFFFGGGWNTGEIKAFEAYADYLAGRGMVAARADYRVKSRQGVTPKECVEDAKSAVRWLRQNAAKLGIDPQRIVASGGSAGGHIAACTALTPGLEAEGEETTISSKANALVLFYPVLRFDGSRNFMERIGNDEALGKAISPTLQLKKDSPPTLLVYGTADKLLAQGEEFMKKSKELGHHAEIFTAEGQPHAFIHSPPWKERTIQRMDDFLVSIGYLQKATAEKPQAESSGQHDQRMQWWREARFGMFIHWGLYAIPAGEWEGKTNHAEWIRDTAHIPVEQYDKFVGQFNPVQFNADQWVRIAKNAGAKYIVITSKHHDGFCLFDSKYTDYDVMSTPFRRDIMKELADACGRQGIKICWYHSIMDWHHPDYLPRRKWEERSAEGADFQSYVTHLKNQLRELVTHYGKIGVLWFDGEWEDTWTHQHGQDLYNYVRSLDPDIIVNNRVDKGRRGMAGLNKEGDFAGDFGTPEQEIPATGLPGTDWETCMTMNNHWGYNSHDEHWKAKEDLIRKLADIASKGGNFLLNVGPTAEGTIPQPSVERLEAIGQWMQLNGQSIYGTSASPFAKLDWGRCTQKQLPDGTTALYLHVFQWPTDGKLIVPGLQNKAGKAYLLADTTQAVLPIAQKKGQIVVSVPAQAPDPINTVVVLTVDGRPVAAASPAK
jgi:alpha-L-fucosidase/acetyl esterase/lipase